MFNLKAKFMLAAAVLFIGGVSAANAQLVDGSAIKVAVPSSFVLRGETFEPGVYTIERTPNTADAPSLLIIRGEGEAMIFDTMISNAKTAAGDTQLVFDTIDGRNYLTAIVVKGQTTKNEIARSKAQKLAITNGASVTQTIMIANTGF
jgi:hypothetical protein